MSTWLHLPPADGIPGSYFLLYLTLPAVAFSFAILYADGDNSASFEKEFANLCCTSSSAKGLYFALPLLFLFLSRDGLLPSPGHTSFQLAVMYEVFPSWYFLLLRIYCCIILYALALYEVHFVAYSPSCIQAVRVIFFVWI